MHHVLVIAGWWTAASVCAVPAWIAFMNRGARRAKRAAAESTAGAERRGADEQSA